MHDGTSLNVVEGARAGAGGSLIAPSFPPDAEGEVLVEEEAGVGDFCWEAEGCPLSCWHEAKARQKKIERAIWRINVLLKMEQINTKQKINQFFRS